MGSTAGQAEPGLFVFRELILLMTLTSVCALAVQNQSPPSTAVPVQLPQSCLSQPSEKISGLLESIHDHSTAGAWNTLGVLYAQADRVSCAIPSFENAIQLNKQDWEPHYNLALALVRAGDRLRA